MSWISIIPPLVVFLLGFYTKRICLSLFVGVLLAATIATGGEPLGALLLTFQGLRDNLSIDKIFSLNTFSDANNFFIVAFVLSLGIIIEIIRESHAAAAFVNSVKSSIKSKRAAETSTLVLAHCLSIDDYLSSLTVGSVMRPLTDKFRIPRAKLAFLTDSMAAPLAMITPVSSWAAAIIGFLTENGVHRIQNKETLLVANPYSVYLNILPYIFYSISLIIAVWFIVGLRLSFGVMKEHEEHAEKTGNLAGGKPTGDHLSESNITSTPATLIDFLVPTGTLMLSTFFYLLYFGHHWLFGGSLSLIGTLQNAPISLVLFFSGITTLLVTSLYFLSNGRFTVSKLCKVSFDGIRLMLPVAAILILSWTMGGLLRENLRTGEWLASLFAGSLPVTLIPLILFWNATLISLALGSSWATTAILLPIALPMVMAMMQIPAPAEIHELPIVFPIFGAILSGAVCGDHISLISETTIMATTSAKCDHMDHVRTQAIYALPVFIGCSLAFLVSGLMIHVNPIISLFTCLTTATVTSLIILYGLHFLSESRSVNPEY